MQSIKIEKIKLKNLDAFAQDALGQAAYRKVAPISLLRSAAQSANPYGRPDDVALLIAHADNECIGYQGLLPGLICNKGALSRVHWSTAFYVAPEYRGQGVAARLLNEVKNLNIDFPVTRMTDSAVRAYEKSGFKELGHLTYYQLRVEKIHKLDFIQKEADAFTPHEWSGSRGSDRHPDFRDAKLYQHCQKVFYQRLMADISIDESLIAYSAVDQYGHEANWVIPLPQDFRRFHRGVEAVNWMLKFRWVVSSDENGQTAGSYYFSTSRDLFKYVALEFYSADRKIYKGFATLSVSSKKGKTRVKILDFAFKDTGDRFLAGYFGLKVAQKYLADRLEFPELLFDYFHETPLLQPLIKKQERLYVYYPKKNGSPLEECRGDIVLDYCDADTAFT